MDSFSPARFCQKNKERPQKRAREKYENGLEEEKEKKMKKWLRTM